MLLLKKNIIFIHFKRRQLKQYLYFEFIYYYLKFGIKTFIYFSKYLVFRKVIDTHISFFMYNFKFKCFSFYNIVINLILLIEFFLFFGNINFFNMKYFIKKKKWNFTVLRSPFVYKKTREQYVFNIYRIYFSVYFIYYDFFLQEYYQFIIKKELNKKLIGFFFIKYTFFFKWK